jgi:hypothetical protein
MKTQNDSISEDVRELVYSDYDSYEQLKAELQEKEKGCGKEMVHYKPFVEPEVCGTKIWEEIEYQDGCHTHKDQEQVLLLCPSCQSKKQGLIQGAKMMIEERDEKELEILNALVYKKKDGEYELFPYALRVLLERKEEILNQSQQNKTASELNPLRQDQLQTGFADTYSQDNKNINSDSNLVVNSDEEPISEGSVRNADFIMDKNLDTQTLIKQALSQRNKEILEIIDKRLKSWEEERNKIYNDVYKNLLIGKQEDYQICQIVEQELKELKQQLTTTSEGKDL